MVSVPEPLCAHCCQQGAVHGAPQGLKDSARGTAACAPCPSPSPSPQVLWARREGGLRGRWQRRGVQAPQVLQLLRLLSLLRCLQQSQLLRRRLLCRLLLLLLLLLLLRGPAPEAAEASVR
jgi:hypothetical protein